MDPAATLGGDRRADQLLSQLVSGTRAVRGALLASVDGRPLAASLTEHHPGSTAAIVASSHALGERLAELSGAGVMQEIVVRSTTGYVAIYAAPPHGVLTVLSDSSVNLAMLHLRARDLTAELARCGSAPG